MEATTITRMNENDYDSLLLGRGVSEAMFVLDNFSTTHLSFRVRERAAENVVDSLKFPYFSISFHPLGYLHFWSAAKNIKPRNSGIFLTFRFPLRAAAFQNDSFLHTM